MKKVYQLLGALIVGSLTSGFAQSAQQQMVCGTEAPSQQWEEAFQQLIASTFPDAAAKKQNTLYTIPVIIHVIHGGQAVGTYPNLAQGQLVSQIRALNHDFGGIGTNSGNYPPTAYSNWAIAENLPANNVDAVGRVKIANCGVQFCLATKDTNGNVLAEPGIERINYNSRGWANPSSFSSYNSFKNFMDGTVKAQTVWNVSRYLNIWVSDENLNAVGGLLGYATFPPISGLGGISAGLAGTNVTDGFYCYARVFGSADFYPSGTFMSNYTKGRTSTHEIGHYLGLRHIWGDGNCANDFCDDTPPGSASNFGTPNYPYKVASCSSNSPDGEMFMNFMDYTNDDAKYMYTEDQATRIQTAMSNSPYRNQLGTHNLCTVQEFAANASFNAPLTVCGSTAVVTLSNTSVGTPIPSFTWNVTGGAFLAGGPNSAVNTVQFPTAGNYTVTLTADNGTVSTMQKVITVIIPTIAVTGASALECLGKTVTLNASGGNYYAWVPSIGSTTNTVSFVVSGTTSYSITGFTTGNCKTSTVVTVSETDCSGIREQQSSLSVLQLQPNPAKSEISVVTSGDAGEITITDLSGKVMCRQLVTAGSLKSTIVVESFEKGIYLVNWKGSVSGNYHTTLVKE